MNHNKPNWPRQIIHIDMDAFYASVEQRDNPRLKGRPVIVGGNPNGRGVVSTCSYEARKFGIHSAMPSSQARRLCQEAIFVSPDFEKYHAVSEQIMAILKQHTDIFEPVSLDEAYLDVTQNRHGILDPVVIASLIKQTVFAVTRLTASAGVAPNMFLAKIASDFQKPNGLTVIYPDEVLKFLKTLPVRKIPGVGPVTEHELHKLNIFTCADLENAGLNELVRHFGKWGQVLFHRSQGIDEREVEPNSESKQYSCEETFETDILDIEWLKSKLLEYAHLLFQNLEEAKKMGRTIVLKVKYFDFEQITRSRTLEDYPAGPEIIYDVAVRLLLDKTLAGKTKIRLLGLGISGLEQIENAAKYRQAELFT